MINDDIIAQLGYTELDSYIGDPSDFELDEYPDLKQRAHDYWKKYKLTLKTLPDLIMITMKIPIKEIMLFLILKLSQRVGNQSGI